MNTIANQTCTATGVSTRRWLHRGSSAAAIVAIVAAAVGLPVIAPERSPGASPVVAIARADCPPDCGGGPGNGGTPSGPPGGGTEFVPPSMPAMPSYEPGRGQPPLDQNNGISIYNSSAPQPSQAAQPSQPPVQNQDGSYTRAANGEQQPVNYNNAPNNQQLSQKWQQLSDQLNNQQSQGQRTEQQPGQNNGQQNQTQNNQDNQDKKQTCQSVLASVRQQFPADLFEFSEEELAQANQEQEKRDRDNEEQKRNRQPPVAQPGRLLAYLGQHAEQVNQYYRDLTAAESAAGLQCSGTNASAGQTNAAAPVREGNNQQPADAKLKDDKDPFSDYFCKNPPIGPPTLADLENANDQAVIANERDLEGDVAAKESDFSPFYPREKAIAEKLAAIAEVPDFSKYDPESVQNGNDNGISSFNYVDSEGNTEHAIVSIPGSAIPDRHGNIIAPPGSAVVLNWSDSSVNVYAPNCNGSYSFIHALPPPSEGEVYPDEVTTEILNALATAGLSITASGVKAIVRLIVGSGGIRAATITGTNFLANALQAAKARLAAVFARQAGLGGSLAQQASALLGKPGDIIALGRVDDTTNFIGRRGFAVLNTPNWSLALNDEFIKAAIEQGRTVRLVSPLEGNMIQTSGPFAGQPTIYARELDMLTKAGYTRVGDYMRPPA